MAVGTAARGGPQGPQGPTGPGSAVLQFGNSALGTTGTRYWQPGYSTGAAGTSARSHPSPITATNFTLYITNGAAGTAASGAPTYTFEVGTMSSGGVFTGSGFTVSMLVTAREASVSGSISLSAGQRVAVQIVVGGTGSVSTSPAEVQGSLVLTE